VIFARVVAPALLAFILVGCRISLSSAKATLLAAKLIAAQSGLGFRMQQAQLFHDMPPSSSRLSPSASWDCWWIAWCNGRKPV
jgi:ABC-type nitrate/sulfonate/bicarbonate transport system permease component